MSDYIGPMASINSALELTRHPDLPVSNVTIPGLLPPAAWYAIHTRSNFEARVHSQLQAKSLHVFLPRVQVMSRRRDRQKKIHIPLFPGYVFVSVRLTPEAHLSILRSLGVVRLLGIKGVPTPVKPEEVANMMILDGTDRTLERWGYIKRGDRVTIMNGPLQGLTGIFQRRANEPAKVVVTVEFLRQAVAVVADEWHMEKIGWGTAAADR